MPRISILLPVRNGAATLPEALDSIARQSCTEYEVIAVNDASDDATVDILQQHRRRDARLRLLDNPEPGLVNALNLGLEQACRSDLYRQSRRPRGSRAWLQGRGMQPGQDYLQVG
ncbi:MAG TPA: glycosyltransferase [Thiohalobacter sp.]|nr:glycosyltransferase [Thiohalobacter sp.]